MKLDKNRNIIKVEDEGRKLLEISGLKRISK